MEKKEIMSRTDTELLNVLDDLTHGYGDGWVLRYYTTGRGLRLHESTGPRCKPTVREAINDYMNTLGLE